MLSSCATSGSGLDRSLPELPTYVQRVEVKDPAAGEDARIVAARERVGRVQANCIIENVKDWHAQLRKAYAGEISPEDLQNKAIAQCDPRRTSRP